MAFIHEASDFTDLLAIVSERHGLARSLVEKDYWVTHTLWTLQRPELEVWFKGGTSLSMGFGLITRYSEDLDLKIGPACGGLLPPVTSWRSEGRRAVRERIAFFEALSGAIAVPGAIVVPSPAPIDDQWRSAGIRVEYPGRFLAELPDVMRPYVLLEVGDARVTPYVERDLTSLLHSHLAQAGLAGEFEDNQPRGIRCVHPLVTLIEKLDALSKRVPRLEIEPASFVRHYEDAARIVAAEARLPPLIGYENVQALAAEMAEQRQIRGLPSGGSVDIRPGQDAEREAAIRTAYDAITPMFWGERLHLDAALDLIKDWLDKRFPDPSLPGR